MNEGGAKSLPQRKWFSSRQTQDSPLVYTNQALSWVECMQSLHFVSRMQFNIVRILHEEINVTAWNSNSNSLARRHSDGGNWHRRPPRSWMLRPTGWMELRCHTSANVYMAYLVRSSLDWADCVISYVDYASLNCSICFPFWSIFNLSKTREHPNNVHCIHPRFHGGFPPP